MKSTLVPLKKAAGLGLVALSLLVALFAADAIAVLRPEQMHTADSKKNNTYVRDGMFLGGDRAINGLVVKDIRRAANPGYERVVIDLQSTKDGEPAPIERPPYYQVAVNPEEKRLVISLWGKPKLDLEPGRVSAAFRKSAVVRRVNLLPKVEEDSWTFVIDLKTEAPVEVFELTHPVRVIIDIKLPRTSKPAPAPKPPKKSQPPKPAPDPEAAPAVDAPAVNE